MQVVAAGRRRASESACLPSPSSPSRLSSHPSGPLAHTTTPRLPPKPRPARRMTSTCDISFLSAIRVPPSSQKARCARPFFCLRPNQEALRRRRAARAARRPILAGHKRTNPQAPTLGPMFGKRDGGWAGTKFSGANAGDAPRGKPQHEAASRLEAASFAPHSGSPDHRFSPTAREAWLLRWSEMWSSRVCMRDRP